MARTVGDARKGQIEVRYPDTEVRLGVVREEFDEVVAYDATVHLEKMSEGTFALIVETRHERACFMLGALNRKFHVDGCEFWRGPINRRSEAQRRRWNALTPAQRKRRQQ